MGVLFSGVGSSDTIIKLAENAAASIHPINIGLRWFNNGPRAIDGDHNGHYFGLVFSGRTGRGAS